MQSGHSGEMAGHFFGGGGEQRQLHHASALVQLIGLP